MKASVTTIVICLSGLLCSTATAVNIDWVTVDNPGNAPDTRYYSPGYGAVSYTYQIGKFEITNAQYCEFLNSVAKTDTYNLYCQWMNGIGRTGDPGNYTYNAPPDWENRPVNYVSWGNAARFCNWLTNGQPTGGQSLTTTEDGSYFINGATTKADLATVTRKADARYVLPTHDEWYKAAYHKNDGITGHYWDYPTASNTVPDNNVIDPDPGNNVNYKIDSLAIGSPYYMTLVGEFENSAGPYGTFDQGGNVNEWCERMSGTDYREVEGGSYINKVNFLFAGGTGNCYESTGLLPDIGIRVVYLPEPASALLIVAGLTLLRRSYRR